MFHGRVPPVQVRCFYHGGRMGPMFGDPGHNAQPGCGSPAVTEDLGPLSELGHIPGIKAQDAQRMFKWTPLP